jgi:hypothetical protein
VRSCSSHAAYAHTCAVGGALFGSSGCVLWHLVVSSGIMQVGDAKDVTTRMCLETGVLHSTLKGEVSLTGRVTHRWQVSACPW